MLYNSSSKELLRKFNRFRYISLQQQCYLPDSQTTFDYSEYDKCHFQLFLAKFPSGNRITIYWVKITLHYLFLDLKTGLMVQVWCETAQFLNCEKFSCACQHFFLIVKCTG